MHCEVACEVLWSILKGHWGCKDETAQAVRAGNLLRPDFQSPAVFDQLENIAKASTGAMKCPAVQHVVLGHAKFRKIRVTAGEFCKALSINEPHEQFQDLAAREAVAEPRNQQHERLYAGILAGEFGSFKSQSDAWDGTANDPKDFQRTVWLDLHDGNRMVLEGVNRSTAIARAVAAGNIDPDAVFAAYELVIPATT